MLYYENINGIITDNKIINMIKQYRNNIIIIKIKKIKFPSQFELL